MELGPSENIAAFFHREETNVLTAPAHGML